MDGPVEPGICGRGSACTPLRLHSPYRMLAGESYPARKRGLWAGTCTLPLFGPREIGRRPAGGGGRAALQFERAAGDSGMVLTVIGGGKPNVRARGSRACPGVGTAIRTVRDHGFAVACSGGGRARLNYQYMAPISRAQVLRYGRSPNWSLHSALVRSRPATPQANAIAVSRSVSHL